MIMNFLGILLIIFGGGICFLVVMTIVVLCVRWVYFLEDLLFPDEEERKDT